MSVSSPDETAPTSGSTRAWKSALPRSPSWPGAAQTRAAAVAFPPGSTASAGGSNAAARPPSRPPSA